MSINTSPFAKGFNTINSQGINQSYGNHSHTRSIVITCGTAGHVFPALILVKEGLEMGKTITFIIDEISGLRYETHINELLKTYGEQLEVVYNKPLKGMGSLISLKFWKDFLKVTKIIYSAANIVTFICGLQGHLLIPLMLLKRKNTYIHEQDSILNKTNRVAHFMIKNINTSFKNVKHLKNGNWIGCPVENLTNIGDSSGLMNALPIRKKIITVLAGTNGSELFDKNIPLILNKIKIKYQEIGEYKIYHNCKKVNQNLINVLYKKYRLNADVSTYFNNFQELIKDSSFLITRGGASTISYLALYKKNSIIIPWKDSAQNHQLYNGEELASVGATILVTEDNIRDLERGILEIIKQERNLTMGEKIQEKFKITTGSEYWKNLN